MELSESLENYLVVIYEAHLRNEIARIKDMTASLSVKHTSAIDAIKKLEDLGIVNYEKRGFVKLTQSGIEKAQKIYKNRMTTRDFFINILDINAFEADEFSFKMEHLKSDNLTRSMEMIKSFFEDNPDIKAKYRKYVENYKSKTIETRMCLDQVKPGEKVRVIEILGSEQIHKRLIIMGITTGIEVEVLKVAPLGDPIEIKIRDYSIAIRKSEAKEVLVIK